MKPNLVFTIIALITIIVIASFGIQLSPVAPVSVPEHLSGQVLYVCPVASDTWNQIAEILKPMKIYFVMAFFFITMLLLFNWGWALYQNLLKDKFTKDSFKNVWGHTKLAITAGIICLILFKTPNYFKTVHVQVRGSEAEYILCESNTPGAKAVPASAVKS